MNNITKYIMCSLIGANITILLGGVVSLIISFLVWDITPLVFLWDAIIEVYTTHKARLLVVSWLIFGNSIYLCTKGY